MGFEGMENNGVLVEDIKLALRGHVKDGYQFNPEKQMAKNDPYYKTSPTLEDRVHVLVSVIPADSLSIMSNEVVRKMREVRLAASDMDIPQMVILTKIDKACREVEENTEKAYYNKYLKEKVEVLSNMLGVPVNCIFLVKNYDKEVRTNLVINTLILSALRQMISFGEDFLNNL
ncbi:interferon-induced protein 44-like [Symphorus nematophorus]